MRPTRPHHRTYDSLAGLPTIAELLDDACPSDTVYVIDGDIRLTAGQLRARAAAYQRRLTEVGVSRGDTVAVQLPNWWEAIAIAHAVWALGAVVNPITPIYRTGELATIFGLSRPKAVFVPQEFRGVEHGALAAEALRQCQHDAVVETVDRGAALRPDVAGDLRIDARDPDDVAMVMFTSGTTGRPKGVLHTHRTLLAESRSIAELFGLEGKRVFMPSPLTHITGLLYGVLMPLQTGAAVVLLDRWDPEVAHEIVAATDCRVTVAATPFLAGLAAVCAERGERSRLEVFVCGGAAIPPHLVRQAEEAMGTSVARTYGSTELPTLCTVPPGDRSEARYTTEGPPIGEAQARLATTQDGAGELEVHGPELFVGYLDAQDNEAAFTQDGWFRTGDLATVDDGGRIAIVGRIKDLIIRGGENISAKEVEDLLLQMPGVEATAVVGVPHPVLGETVCAVVVSAPASDVSLRAVTEHLAGADIARQKWPEALVRAEELPSTSSGKIQKFLVRELALERIRSGRAETRV